MEGKRAQEEATLPSAKTSTIHPQLLIALLPAPAWRAGQLARIVHFPSLALDTTLNSAPAAGMRRTKGLFSQPEINLDRDTLRQT